MCRLFAFRSVIPSQVHRSLMAADNALGAQSDKHRDGWGVAFYVDDSPHITRSPTTAIDDHLFHRVSGIVASETVLAHVRKATVGNNSVLNCHPFQYGRWTMAHNGEIRDFERHRAAMRELVDDGLRRYILGDTDSEVIFFIFLTFLRRRAPLYARFALEDVFAALRQTITLIRERCDTGEPEGDALLTIIVTDGTLMAATQGGKELFVSTYKTRCADRDECKSLSPECEAPTVSGYVNHLVLSSERMGGENVWLPLEPGEIIGVDARMRLHRERDGNRRLPVVS
ncbi:MAG: class II glutamine amidotransferase [Sandaracinaceae bacterium]|nr:class II glutamine amidotransferase [Sandaracinaceae bacterium]MBP7684717.1 class II glutamine amidotransferase [Deltaproteobacteria bacterium]MBK6808133.1 class II glutamine amidotransferase [Sandaracinaceae bacterium]MBK7151039.1 class II glutamine amidotransferase [Sandaracinaceae bacterium]MBK7773158.1 class II glutamine amidotransferase [Sandaracinaceae bacterium]